MRRARKLLIALAVGGALLFSAPSSSRSEEELTVHARQAARVSGCQERYPVPKGDSEGTLDAEGNCSGAPKDC